jgi:peptide/nickel transport system permease protein
VGSRSYLLRKVVHAISTLLFVIAFNFLLFRMMPSDPVQLLARSQHLSREEVTEQIEALGLCVPPEGQSQCTPLQELSQLPAYLRATFTGDFGTSVRSAVPVTELIAGRVWPTLLLVGLSTIFSTVFGILIGIKGAWQRGSLFDTSTLFGSLALYATPEGWLGMILIIIFSGWLGWFPAGQYQSPEETSGIGHVADVLNHLFLPVLTLTLGYIGEYAIVMRSSVLEVMRDDFVQTARAKGVRDKDVRRRHAVPNAILPTLTLVFYSFGFVLGGAIVVETVFSWPGIGQLTYQAIQELDYPVIQAVFLLTSVLVIAFNLAADILYGYLDPRVRGA